MHAIIMNEKNQSKHSNDERAHEAPTSDRLGVADILIGIASKNDPPSPGNVGKRVRHYGSGSARIEQIEDNMDGGSESSISGEGGGGNIVVRAVATATMPRTRTSAQHRSGERIAAASVTASRDSTASAVAKKQISPAERHALMAKRRQVALFRMQERRRVQSCREKAVMQMARNMLSPEQVKELEEAVAKKKRQQQEKLPRNGATIPAVEQDTKESNPNKSQN